MLFAGMLLLVLTGGLTGVRAWHERAIADAAHGAACARFAQDQRVRAAADSGSGPHVLVIGDSWSAGYRLPAPQASWPVRLPGRVHVDGFPGSGFSVGASDCGPVGFDQRVLRDLRLDPTAQLVVIEGGLNDFDQSEAAISDGFHRLMARLHGRRVVVVGPASAPSRAAAVPRVDRLLASLCEHAGVPYLSTVGLELSYLPDRLHPDQAGSDAFGDAVAAFVAAHASRAE
jgi:acyl-CoA thioesterase-1